MIKLDVEIEKGKMYFGGHALGITCSNATSGEMQVTLDALEDFSPLIESSETHLLRVLLCAGDDQRLYYRLVEDSEVTE